MLVYEDFINVFGSVEMHDRYFLAVCPFHDDHKPSMLVFKDGWFRCLGCNRVGGWETLWNRLHGWASPVAPETNTRWRSPLMPDDDKLGLEEIAYQAHLDITHFDTFQWYLRKRGIESKIDDYYLGYWRGWYTFPIFDRNHAFVSMVFRAAPHIEHSGGQRYWYKGPNTLYIPDWRLLEQKKLFLTYGILDAVTLAMLGYPAASVTAGTASFKAEVFEDFRFPIYILPDQDEQNSVMKHVGSLGWRGNLVLLQFGDGMKDVNDFVQKGQTAALRNQLARY